MKELKISFLGPIKRPQGVDSSSMRHVDRTATVGELLSSLGYSREETARLRVLVDGHIAKLSDHLGDASEITLFLPLGGG